MLQLIIVVLMTEGLSHLRLESALFLQQLKILMHLRLDAEKNPARPLLTLLIRQVFEMLADHVLEFGASLREKQILPLRLLLKLNVLPLAITVRLDHISALILQEEPLRRVVERLLVHVKQLIALD